jgi:hypothetical protein
MVDNLTSSNLPIITFNKSISKDKTIEKIFTSNSLDNISIISISKNNEFRIGRGALLPRKD